MTDQGELVPVDIAGQRYPIRTALDPAYVTRLAAFVDARMRAADEATPGGDSVRLAVLAALNIADELFRGRESITARDGQIAERAGALERMVDQLLMT